MALITYKQAKDHLHLTTDDAKKDVLLKMEHATAIVLDYIDRLATAASPDWTDATDPASDRDFALVQAAILIVLGDLYRFRGDDDERDTDAVTVGYINPRAVRILHRLRTPALG